MGKMTRLTTSDGHQLDAYRAPAQGESRGAVVIVQEIFGVNGHIRDVCDRYAVDGFEAIAPALFDRVRCGVELDYNPEGIKQGRELAASIGWEGPALDIQAAAQALRPDGNVAAIGYCWGASWTWVAACRGDLAAAVCYYGRHIVEHLDTPPRCPVLMHFGAEDASIPLEDVEKIRAAFPHISIHTYDGAGHGFNCDRRADFRPEQATVALQRTYGFLKGAN
jgi:carboxymethylenebutenolidase